MPGARIEYAKPGEEIDVLSAACAQLFACNLDTAGLAQHRVTERGDLVGTDHQRVAEIRGGGLRLGLAQPCGTRTGHFIRARRFVRVRGDLREIIDDAAQQSGPVARGRAEHDPGHAHGCCDRSSIFSRTAVSSARCAESSSRNCCPNAPRALPIAVTAASSSRWLAFS